MSPRKHKRSTHWLDVADLERFFGLGWIGPHEWNNTLGRGKTPDASQRKWERFKSWLKRENVPHEKRWDESDRDCEINTGSVAGVVKVRFTEDTLSYLGMTDTHDEFVGRFDQDRYFCLEHWVSTCAERIGFAAVA